MTCEYCGTQYKQEVPDFSPMVIKSTARAHELKANVALDQDFVRWDEQHASDFACRQIVDDIASGLAPYIEYRSEYDPMCSILILDSKVVNIK